MEQFIGCDAHKQFSVFVAVNEKGQAGDAIRVPHERRVYREFLARLPAKSSIAIEASGHYSWIVDEMERLGHCPKLANPFEAKRRMGLTKKTDKLDAKGLAILLRKRDASGSVDSAERIAGPARTVEVADLPGSFTHACEEPRSWHACSSQCGDSGQRYFRCRGPIATRQPIAGNAGTEPESCRARIGDSRFP